MDENPAAVTPDPGLVSLESAATREGSDGPAAPLRDALAPGSLLAGRYRIERFLARGGMGEVHQAHDELLDIGLALKTLRLDLEGDPVRLRSFKRELLLARSITHPNVCRVYDLEVDRSTRRVRFFLTMELLAGETLRSRILVHGALTPGKALPLVRQMATALGAAHAAGIVHRDFKSANVMLVPGTGGERAVVTDFGLARLHQAAETEAADPARAADAGDVFGTPAYMAPEQVRGEPAGPAADVYALGVVLFEMVTGRLPFEGETPIETAMLRLTADPPLPGTLVADLDVRWDGAIRRCLAREPGDRFGRVEDVVTALAGDGDVAVQSPSRQILPAERDAFVGRGAALDELAQHLDRGARLVTLVGPGGTGKTRLAVRHGWSALDVYPGGVWFCDLTEARTLDGIAAAVANALEVPLGKGDPIVQLGHAIAVRGKALFILDNFEQIVEHAAATVGRWLERAPEVHIIVTSRERLAIPGEEVQTLEPLDEEEGIGLFLARARAYRPNLGHEAGEQEGVRHVVRLVEGLPLAIELAAARVRMMGIGQIVERLKDRFRLLADGRPNGKHATLKATIDSSWELLQPWERAAFAQCAVFEGGFTLEAAEEVLDLSPWAEAPWVVDVVQALVDKSLVRMRVPEGGRGEPRFTMYVSLHEYARERLPEGGSWAPEAAGAEALASVEERHARYYARFGTDEALAALDGRGGIERRRRLAAELDNLVAACQRAVARRDGETAVNAFAAAWEVLDLRGPLAAGLALGQAVLAIAGLPPAARARAAYLSGLVHRRAGRMEEAQEHLERALTIHREAGDRGFEGILLGALGSLHQDLGRMEPAREHYERAVAIHREVGNRRFEGVALGTLGALYRDLGRMEEAREHYDCALAIHREGGDRRFEGIAFANLGQLLAEQGRIEEARAHFEGALAVAREVGDRGLEGYVLGTLGILHANLGRMEEAREHFERALAIQREIGSRRAEGNDLSNLGALHGLQGRMEEARECYERALAIHREIGNRQSEGAALTLLGILDQEQGRMDEASARFAEGERLLRDVDDRIELGKLLCARGELEIRIDQFATAQATLAEAESLVAALGAGPDSELGRKLTLLRQSVARPPEIAAPEPTRPLP